MPVGNAYATGSIVAFIDKYHLKNKSLTVLDMGCGIGHNGFIFREMFEIRYLRLKPEDWFHRVEAIEIFEAYRNPVWDYVYDKVIIGDCLKVVSQLEDDSYDIVFATELLEHFDKEKIYFLLDEVLTKLAEDGSIIITIPVGEKAAVLQQKDVFGNVYETHKTFLNIKDFDHYNIKHVVNNGIFMIGRQL